MPLLKAKAAHFFKAASAALSSFSHFPPLAHKIRKEKAQASQRLRVLIVDDKFNCAFKAWRAVFESRLDCGIEVFFNPVDAWRAFKKRAAAGIPYDIVFTDYDMPYMKGLEFLQRIKTNSPETKVVMVSANASIESFMDEHGHSSLLYSFESKHFFCAQRVDELFGSEKA